MENTIVIAKIKKWNFRNLPLLYIGILAAVIAFLVIITADGDDAIPAFVIFLFISAIYLSIAFIIKAYYKKLTLTITDKWIFSKRWFGKKTSIPMEKVSYISTGVFKRISIHSDGGKLTLWGCKNDDEVFGAITSRINP